MKKLLLALVLMILGVISCNAKSNNGKVLLMIKSVQVGDSIITPSNANTPHRLIFSVDTIIQVMADDYLGDFIDFHIYNISERPIMLKWEDARMNWSKVIFNTDRPITMDSQPKPDEKIYPHSSSVSRQITSRSKYINGVRPLYDRDKLKNGGNVPIIIDLPITFDNVETKLYTFQLEYRWVYK